MNKNINILTNNDEIEALVLDDEQVLQTIGSPDLFPHLPKAVRDNCKSIELGGGEPIILVVAPLDNRKPIQRPFNYSAKPEVYAYHVTVAKELRDVGIYSRSDVQQECRQIRDIYFGVSPQQVETSKYKLYSTLAA